MLTAVSFVASRRSGSHLALLAAATLTGLAGSTLEGGALVPTSVRPGATALLEGEVESVDQRPGHARVDLKVSAVDGHPARFRARLWPGVNVLPGQRVSLRARLKATDSAANPGERGSSRRERRAVRFTGTAAPASLLVLSEPSWARATVERQRARLAAAVRPRSWSADGARLYLALAAGLRADLGDEVETDFARSGLAHVLSVSGLHVAALGLFTLAVLRRLIVLLPFRRLRRFEPRALAAPGALLLIWAYVAFTGSEPPAVRSGVMTSMLLLGAVLQRRSDPLNALAIALWLLLLADPSSIADLSLQLSGLSALAMIVVSPALRELVPLERPDAEASAWRWRWHRLRETVLQSLCASAAVMAVNAPLIAQAFERVGVAGLVSNVVCLPLCAAVSVLAAGGAALFVVLPAAAGPVLWLGTTSCEALLWAARLFSKLPWAAVAVPSPPGWLMALFVLGVFLWALSSGRRRWLGLLAPVAAVLLFALPALTPRSSVEVTFLAVGHGDAVVVSAGGEHALIDGGGVPGGTDTAERFVLPYLKSLGVDRLELTALSHAHPDHALGLISALKHLPTARLWLPAGAEGGELTRQLRAAAGPALVEAIELGQPPLTLGPATLEVLGPPADRVLLESENDRSMVLRLRHGEVTFLLTGDVEQAGEEHLEPGPVTVMKAPHHGSRTSSSPELLDRARPRFVVFCVGRGNRFGFPHREVVERYEALGARCYRTDLDGAVTFKSDGHAVEVETFKSEGEVWRSARRAALGR